MPHAEVSIATSSLAHLAQASVVGVAAECDILNQRSSLVAHCMAQTSLVGVCAEDSMLRSAPQHVRLRSARHSLQVSV